MASLFTEFESFKLAKVKVTDQVLGRGAYATVLEVKYKGQQCAGKKIHEVLLMQGNHVYAVKRFEEECRLLSQVQHPNIVQFIGLYFQKNAQIPILVMEYLPTNLSTFIEKEKIVPKEIAYSILLDVVKGFFYLHSRSHPIIHRDLSSNNVLLTTNMVAKISDLGVARILDLTPLQVSRMTQTPGTPSYMPPEVMIAKPTYDMSVDVFSYGILMIHVLSGRWPEPQIGQIHAVGEKLIPVSEAERRQTFLDAIGNDHPLTGLILKCIDNNPRSRPHVGEIKEHLAKVVQEFPRSHGYQLKLAPPTDDDWEHSLDRKGKIQRKKVKVTYDYLMVKVGSPSKQAEATTKASGSSCQDSKPAGDDKVRSTSRVQKPVEKKTVAQSSAVQPALCVQVSSETPATSNHPMYVMNCDYKTSDSACLNRGDRLCIVNTDKKDWWLALSPVTGKQTYIPKDCLTELPYPVYVASYDYKSHDVEELSFKRDEELCIIHTGDGDWWYACSLVSKEEGFVPRNHVIEASYPVCAALYDYESRTRYDLAFKKCDLFYVINDSDKDWLLARSMDSTREGYIPGNYVAKVDPLKIHKWYFGDISRTQAEKLLYEEGNQCGSFLVRQSESVRSGYSLSIQTRQKVTHYKIKRERERFFVTERATFKSIADLISHYQQQLDRLCVRLSHACISSERPQTAGLCKPTSNEDVWEINRREIRLVKSLGSGQYSQVWGGLWNGKVPVAVKILKPNNSDVSDFLREVSLMKKLRHPKLVQLFGVCMKDQPYYIVTELVKHGSLLYYLRSPPVRGKLKLPQLISMAEQVAEGMAYLASEQYIHRDLAARNVLVDYGMVCKITDYGLMRSVSEADDSETKFAIKWTAPEALMHNQFSFKSDMWSFGVLLYEIITYGRSPYPGLTNQDVAEKLMEGYRMAQPEECSDMYYNIMLKCWREEPENRPSFEGLLFELEEFLEFSRSSSFVFVSGTSK